MPAPERERTGQVGDEVGKSEMVRVAEKALSRKISFHEVEHARDRLPSRTSHEKLRVFETNGLISPSNI